MAKRRSCPVLIFLSLLLVEIPFAHGQESKKMIKIGVAQTVSRPDLNSDAKGFEKALSEAGFKEGVHITYLRENSKGSVANAEAIAQKFRDMKVDLIHSIATLASQATASRIKNIPIIFSSVYNPVDTGIVPKRSPAGTKTRTNVTGVSDLWPVHLQFEMFIKFLPKAKKWGTIYNRGDQKSLVYMKEMREAAEELGVVLIESTVSNRYEIVQAAQSLVGKVQAIHITSDDTIASSLEKVVKLCNEKKIPLFIGDVYSVSRGAVAAYGLNYYLIGHAAGRKAVQVLKGKRPGSIPWGPEEKFSLVINEKAARAQGVIIPPELLKKADKVI